MKRLPPIPPDSHSTTVVTATTFVQSSSEGNFSERDLSGICSRDRKRIPAGRKPRIRCAADRSHEGTLRVADEILLGSEDARLESSGGNKNIRHVSRETLELLQSYAWPGNIRELQNVIERSVILCETDTFSIDESWLPQHPQPFLTAKPKNQIELPRRIEEQEKNMIEEALKASRGRVFGPVGGCGQVGHTAVDAGIED